MRKYPYRKNVWYNGVKIDVRANSAEELDIKYAKKIAAIERGQITTGGATPVDKWVEHYFDVYVAEYVVPDTLADRKRVYRRIIKPYIGAKKIKDVNSGHCQVIISSMAGYSKSYIDKTCQLLFNIFKKARSEKLIYENPAEDLNRPAAKDGQRRAATMQERALMLMTAETGHRGGLWLKTILYCGMRPSETGMFLGKHINYEAGLVYVDGTKSAAAKRIVPVPASLLAEFKALNRKPDEYIFKNTEGYKMRKSSRDKLWKSFKREMNILAGCKVYRNQLQEPLPVADDLVPYCFRHSFATDLKDANVPYRIRQEFLGHSDCSVTDNYTHRTEASLQTGRQLLEAFRRKQDIEVQKAMDDIRLHGFCAEKNVEDLTSKYFPGV